MKGTMKSAMRAFSMRCGLALLLLASSLALRGEPARADGITGRAMVNLGAWSSQFSQSDSAGHSTRVTSLIGPAMQMNLGAGFGLLFVEYNINWLVSQQLFNGLPDTAPSSRNPRNAGYYSLLGFQAGIRTPILPLEGFIGYERGNYGFSNGAETDYSGPTIKLGLSVFLHRHAGIKAEYRRMFVGSDDSGSLPSGVSTRMDALSLMMVFGLR
jgi:hypothetical protein